MADEVHELWEQNSPKIPRYGHISLNAPCKCACNTINALQTQPSYKHAFSVYQKCAWNEYCFVIMEDWNIGILEYGSVFRKTLLETLVGALWNHLHNSDN